MKRMIMSPEGMEVANCYIVLGNIKGVAQELCIDQSTVAEILNKREIKKYVDTVYLDQGYRNRNAIGSLLDEMIASKLEEAQESGIYTNKDLADLMMMAHKMRMDELKANSTNIHNQTNVQINDTSGSVFGDSNYGKLMQKILESG